MRNKFLLLLLFFSITWQVWAQTEPITGVVKESSTGQTLPGVSVSIKGTTQGVVTDANGRFKINAKKDQTLVFSFIGFGVIEKN
jgi:hypothetical protein